MEDSSRKDKCFLQKILNLQIILQGDGRRVNTSRLTVSRTAPQRSVIAASYCLDTNYATENAPQLFMLKKMTYRHNGISH
jgi:hypothetical protein